RRYHAERGNDQHQDFWAGRVSSVLRVSDRSHALRVHDQQALQCSVNISPQLKKFPETSGRIISFRL
ncbi:hypothetical protein ACI2KS_14605, partial [Pseudomonas sp. NPDC087358]|uniref:hypothetical protein n=1 Tax=Pseudomonas sp. NPDC087358 TaxID=3364439 RepID=UPI00384BA9E0